MDAFEKAVRTVQFLSVDGVEKAKSGHPGTPMALAAIGVDIFTRYLRYLPDCPDWPNRDRFVLSCGHASMLLYSLLHLAGYDLPLEELKNFRQWGSLTPGHPEHGLTAGVETTTGPLGQGFGNAVGMALASKMAGQRLNRPGSEVFDYRVFALASDGDLMEGVSSEAASIAGHLKLDNLIVVYDDNRVTIDGSTALSFSEDVGLRFQAYGWNVQRVDGHDPGEVRAALDQATRASDRPQLIVARTHIGIGSPQQDTSAAHGSPLGADSVKVTKEAAGWPLEPFHVPDGADQLFRERVRENRPRFEAWERTVRDLDGARAETYKALLSRAVPESLFDELLASVESKDDATRSLAAKVEQRAAELVPCLVGGAADLAESTKTTLKGAADVGPGEYGGRNFHFGIREHGMGAILNGLALSGLFIPFGSTFLIFSDYMRPPIRLAALMEQQVVYVFTHDSVFLGEDGPTHQPIEQLAALRLIPNLDVVRPADALECAAAWTYALSRREGPTALALSRQKLPALKRPAGFDPKRMLAGAYVVREVERPDLVLIATGSEVHVAVDAAERLAGENLRVRVVSAPCWQAFQRKSAAEQAEVLPPGVRRASVEAGRTELWRAAIGRDGVAIGIDRFGASAPYQRIAEELGLTGEKIARTIVQKLHAGDV
jgi:transketolase